MIGKKCIVAVDDSGIILKMLEKLLSGEYAYYGFSKGMRALKFLKETRIPHLIILDIEMPGFRKEDIRLSCFIQNGMIWILNWMRCIR